MHLAVPLHPAFLPQKAAANKHNLPVSQHRPMMDAAPDNQLHLVHDHMRFHLLAKNVKIYRSAVNFLCDDLVFASSNTLFLTLYATLAQKAYRPIASSYAQMRLQHGYHCATERFTRWPLKTKAVILEKGLPTSWHSLQLCCYYTETHVT